MSVKDDLTSLINSKKIEIKPVERKKRTLGDIYVTIEAQKIYNPNLPSVPRPIAPPANQQKQGSAANIGTEGRWGKPEAK